MAQGSWHHKGPDTAAVKTCKQPHNNSGQRTYLMNGAPMVIGELIRALPTNDDIKSMICNLEDTFQKETQEIRGELLGVSNHV